MDMDTRRVLVLSPCVRQEVVNVPWNLFDQLSFLVEVARVMKVDLAMTRSVQLWSGELQGVRGTIEVIHDTTEKKLKNIHMSTVCGMACVVASTSSPTEQAHGVRIFEDIDHFMSLKDVQQALQLYQDYADEHTNFKNRVEAIRQELRDLPVHTDAVRVDDDCWRESLLM